MLNYELSLTLVEYNGFDILCILKAEVETDFTHWSEFSRSGENCKLLWNCFFSMQLQNHSVNTFFT